MRTVEGAYPLQAPDDVGDLASEQSSVGVELVDDHKLQAREKAAPPGVVRQQSGVQHVGVGHDDVAAFADGGPATGRRIAVVRVDANLDR